MNFKYQVHRFAQPQLKTPRNAIWISDDLFNSALRRFVLLAVSRRHGSYVPGPLEARRRAAKRRIMNLAEAGGETIDPGFLAGNNPGHNSWNWQWQGPTGPVLQQPIHPLEKGEQCCSDSIKHD